MELECKLYMPEGSDITINSGGKLKILSGQITNNRNKLLSNIIINNGGYLELVNTSIGNIRVVNNSGGSVSFNEEIDITNIGQVFCKENSYVCLNTNLDLNLNNFFNSINFYGNVNMGLNPIINENSGICTLDYTNIPSTGQGTINLIEDGVVFIQNTQFIAPEYTPASIIKIGTNVNPNATSGPVILYNGSHLYLNASNEITIQGDFEIQPGAEFTLEMR